MLNVNQFKTYFSALSYSNMRNYFLSLLFIILSSQAFAQQIYTDKYINQRIDSAWKYLDYRTDIDRGREIGEELLNIDEEHNEFLAKVNAYQIMGEYHYWIPDMDSAFYFYQLANDLAIKEKDKSEIAYTSLALASLNSEAQNYDLADSLFQKAIDIRYELKDTNDIMFILEKRAWMNTSADHHELAMQDFMQALELAQIQKDTSYLSSLHNGIAVVHKKQGNFEEAIESFTKSAETTKAQGDFHSMYAAIGNRAMVYKSQGLFEKAFEPWREIYHYYDSVDYPYGKVSALANMQIIKNRMKSYEESVSYGEKALPLSKEVGWKHSESDILNELGISYLALGQAEKAANYSEQSKVLADETIYVEKQKDARKTLTDIYEDLGQFEEALINFKEYKALHDSIFQKEKSNQVLELQTRYETAEKEKNIQELEAKAEIDRLNRNYLMGGIGLLIVLFSIILNREMQRRKKARQLADAEQARLQDQIDFKNRELTSQALNLARKNEMLQEIKNDLEVIRKKAEQDSVGDMKGVFQKINFDKQIDKNWEQFTQTFTQTNESFIQNLTSNYPDLTKNDLRLAALLRMNLGTKDIATILNISDDGVKKARYRLRKKLNLDTSDNLDALVMGMN